jgi:phosphoenolpyruvate carboxykinase (ATP)
MLGESIETSAGDPEHAGKSIRVVGTNPFIIGSEDEEGNRFYQFIKDSKIECYLLNTGRFGENGKNNGVKITVKDSSNFIIEAARGRIKWKSDEFWGYRIPTDLKKFDWKKYYEKKEYRKLNSELKTERIAWLTKFKKLHRKVKNALF